MAQTVLTYPIQGAQSAPKVIRTIYGQYEASTIAMATDIWGFDSFQVPLPAWLVVLRLTVVEQTFPRRGHFVPPLAL